jgi:hypothetical protein
MSEPSDRKTAPRFAVVGHPNKGKSSIVAAMAEDDDVAISGVPGTTTVSREYPLRVDDEELYALIDTPGFQRPRQALAWLKSHAGDARDRPGLIRDFVRVHRGQELFRDECELLTPLIEGAGILYVVDGSSPYGSEYEAEMEILRWTGRPRMALINLIGSGRFVDEWKTALDQFFGTVRVFDAHHADFDKRIELLRAFKELHEPWSAALTHAIDVLIEDRRLRHERASGVIADLLIDVLTAKRSREVADGEASEPHLKELEQQLIQALREAEQRARRTVEDLYQHQHLERQEDEITPLRDDLFSERAWNLFGLSKTQLVATAAAGGAAGGAVIDALLGGSSFLLGAGIGALLAGTGAWMRAEQLAEIKVLGIPLGGTELIVGPVGAPNFPWVVLGRAWLHHRLVAERNHARRDHLVLDTDSNHQADRWPMSTRHRLDRLFHRIRSDGSASPGARNELADLVASLPQGDAD